MRARLLILLLLLTLVAAGCIPESAERRASLEQQWPADQVSEIDLKSLNGSMTIRASQTDQVDLRAEIRSRRSQEAPLKIDLVDGTLRIRERWTKRRFRVVPFLRGEGGSVRYELTIPEDVELRITTTNGRIDVEGVRGEQNLRSVNGRIEVSTPDAILTATTVNGRIRAAFTQEFRGARLRTVNGSVRITVPHGSAIAADVDTVNGSFNSSLPVVVHADRPPADRVPLEVTTVNGSVTLAELDRL